MHKHVCPISFFVWEKKINQTFFILWIKVLPQEEKKIRDQIDMSKVQA